MPELPEVETVAAQLGKLITGSEIISAELLRARLAPHNPPEEFSKLLSGTTVRRVHRRGKHILLDLDCGHTLIVHLRMSGRFMLLDEEADEPRFTHSRFLLGNGKKLLFQDQRHFGFMHIVSTNDLHIAKEIARLAPEPFSEEFSPEYLRNTAARSTRMIKEFLLDQTKVCGVGNIYASESLFIAGISPKRKANMISRPMSVRLHRAIVDVLFETIELGRGMPIIPENIGGSIYGDSDTAWRVYGREGEPCANCERPLRRIVQAGRSTFYCVFCQK